MCRTTSSDGGIDGNFIFFKKLSLNGFLVKTFSADRRLRGHDWASTIDASYNSNLVQVEAFRTTVPNRTSIPKWDSSIALISSATLSTLSFRHA